MKPSLVTKRIVRNRKIFESFVKRASKPSASLALLELCAYVGAHNNTGFLAARKLEDLCLKRCVTCEDVPAVKTKGILFVVSELHEVGGHTRVVADLMRALEEKSSLFILRPDSVLPSWIEHEVALDYGTILWGDNDPKKCAQKLRRESFAYKHIILITNPEEIIPMLAYGQDYPRPIYFYNHADHKLSLGFSVAKSVLEMVSQGVQVSQQYRGIPQSSYLSIPCGLEPHFTWHSSHRILTMASGYKLVSTEEYSFQNFVRALLAENRQVLFEVIGVTADDEDWQALKSQYGARLLLHGLCSKAEVKRLVHGAHLFVDSFPVHSYLSSLEAVYYGIPVLSLKTTEPTLSVFEKSALLSEDALVQRALEMLTWEDSRIRSFVEEQQRYAEREHAADKLRDRFHAITRRYDGAQALTITEVDSGIHPFTIFQESQASGLFNITLPAVQKLPLREKLFVVKNLLKSGVLWAKMWNYLKNRQFGGV